MKKMIAGVCIIAVLLFYIRGTVSTPEKTIKNFEKAFNEQDYNGMLECIDPMMSTAVRGGVNLVGGLFGVDGSDLIDLFPLLTDLTEEFGAEYMQMDLEILEIAEDGDSAWAMIKERNSGEIFEWYLMKEDGKWYLLLD